MKIQGAELAFNLFSQLFWFLSTYISLRTRSEKCFCLLALSLIFFRSTSLKNDQINTSKIVLCWEKVDQDDLMSYLIPPFYWILDPCPWPLSFLSLPWGLKIPSFENFRFLHLPKLPFQHQFFSIIDNIYKKVSRILFLRKVSNPEYHISSN